MPGGDRFFTRIALLPAAVLYEHAAAAATPGWYGFVVPRGDQPAELSFAAAWSNYLGNPAAGDNGGLFIVGAARPADPSAYLTSLIQVVGTLNARTNFAYRYLFLGDVAGVCPCVLPFYTTAADPTVPGQIAAETSITARNLGIVASQNAYIYADTDTNTLRLASNGGAGIVLASNKYVSKNLNTLTSDVRFPFDGDRPGAFNFSMTLRFSTVPDNDDFTLLDVGIKYFTERGNKIISQRYPVFGMPVDKAPIPMIVHFDPLRPLDHARTQFLFAGSDGKCAPMDSTLKDGFAHPVRVVPKAGVSALVPQTDTVTIDNISGKQSDFFYLVPSGPFGLEPAGTIPPATRLMCGLSPLETIIFDPPGSIITYAPDQSAFAPLLSAAAAGTPRLTDRYLTAWCTVTAADWSPNGPASVYLSQPKGAAMFASGTVPTTYLEHQDVPACVLRDASPAASFPAAFYGAVIFGAHPDTFTQDDVARLETDIVSVERRVRITAHGAQPGQAVVAGPTTVMTPQGFLVVLATDGSGAWKRLHLAQTSWSRDPAKIPPAVTTLALDDVDDTLRAAFQTNQQCLIITQPKKPWTLENPTGSGTKFEDELLPQGWPFRIRVGQGSNPGDYRNVLIFKFCDGALEARVDDPSRWTAADDFNDDPSAAAQWLRSYIDAAKVLAKGTDGAYFQRFVDAVTTPTWQGILALRTDVDPSALPMELRGLVAGLDLSLFNAHHLGVDISFVDSSSGKFAPDGNSAVFATVYYVDPEYQRNLDAGANPDQPIPAAAGVDYAFRILTLKCLFVNAEISAFASKSQVTLNKLFGDTTGALAINGVAAPSTSLSLDATYENHNEVGQYTFRTNSDACFRMLSNLWRGIEISSATFACLRAPASGTVLSRFSFNGYLNFATLRTDDGTTQAPFDLLSFGGTGTGTEPDKLGTGLRFSDLRLNMSFDTASPGSPTFDFLTDQMTFAASVEQSRPESLYARMPLTLTGFVAGTGQPASLGYLPINLPNLAVEPLGDRWNGLAYTFDLGSAGGMSAKAGLSARLLIAWAPLSQGNGVRFAAGLALPGTSPTSRALSLQGVLKLTVERILLYRDPTTTTFVLRLNNVLLSLLGITLPPGASSAFIVFGNPEAGKRDVVGWYAALNREKKPTPEMVRDC